MKLFPKGKSFYCFTLPTWLRKYETKNQSQSKSFIKFAKDRYEFLFRKYIHEQTFLLIVSKYDYWGLAEILRTVLVLCHQKKKKKKKYLFKSVYHLISGNEARTLCNTGSGLEFVPC